MKLKTLKDLQDRFKPNQVGFYKVDYEELREEAIKLIDHKLIEQKTSEVLQDLPIKKEVETNE